jgi:pimeloyl-ACP methyl ester carboxylesterase
VQRFRPALSRVLVAVVLCVPAAGCNDSGGGGGGADTARPDRTEVSGGPSVAWHDCGSVECASLPVPLDESTPDRTIDLALARRRADEDPIGILLTNPGGPGASGLSLAANADRYFSDEILDHFDIVAWDPRGVGQSAPVDCVDDLDFFFAVDHSPDDAREVAENVAASERLADGCADRSGALLPYVSSRATVRDMDRIRAALGEEQLSYVGFSYGTYLGALYADQFPERVRAMVLDGAVDPALDFAAASRGQALGFERALDAFLDDCARRDCGFGGDDPHRSYSRLMAAIDAEELPAELDGEDRRLGPGEADLGVATALYGGTEDWPVLADALRRAAQGDGSRLLALADQYTGRRKGGEYSNAMEAFYAIGCLDVPAPTDDEVQALADELAVDAPNFGPATVWLSNPCAHWPVAPGPAPGPVRGVGAPPILVVGTTNDPATPFAWAEALAAELQSARLLVFEAEGHTAYTRGNDCVDDAVDQYLVDLVAPLDEARC